jgi:alcohol dehydrogenase class IV
MVKFAVVGHWPALTVYGNGVIEVLGERLPFSGGTLLIITDQGVMQTELIQRISVMFKSRCAVYAELNGEPTTQAVQRAVDFCRAGKFQGILGVGGGSVLDTTKLVSVLCNGNRSVEEVLVDGKVGEKTSWCGLVPTTAGTGSEATPNAIVKGRDGEKKAVVSRAFVPDLIILDPELTQSLPASLTASTGMDALCHNMESYFSTNSNIVSDLYAREGIRLIAKSLERSVRDGSDLAARGDLLLGSFFGGLALSLAGTAAVHALAYPLGKRGVPHGVAIGMLLPWVLDLHREAYRDKLAPIADLFPGSNVSDGVEGIVQTVHHWLDTFPMPAGLADYSIPVSEIPTLAVEALQNERLLQNNPRALSQTDVEAIYEKVI